MAAPASRARASGEGCGVRRFISFTELAAMSDKDLSDAALGGSTAHREYWFLLQYLRAERTKAREASHAL
jgi:hypothetical protein